MIRCWLALLAVALSGCDGEPLPAPAPVAAAQPRVDASDLFTRYECNRCHDLPDAAPAADGKHCVHCHDQIQTGTFVVEAAAGKHAPDAATLARWRSRITSLRWVPSLVVADRLRRSWIRDFLLAPHDVRPGLVAEMPRLALTAADAERIAAALAPEHDSRSVDGDITRGASLYRELCTRCHRFSGTPFDGQPSATDAAAALAPDLRHARDRMTEQSLAAWIEKPRGAMPPLGITAADARALAALIARTPLTTPPSAAPPARLPLLARDVTWDEVEAKVFRSTCWHCHSEPDFARGDGGPGNTGGFGFAPRGLDVSSYAAISAGALDDQGQRRSIFTPLADGTPRLVAHLYARHIEKAGGSLDGIRGMPLGLPPLPLEQIQLVESWIAQGRPR